LRDVALVIAQCLLFVLDGRGLTLHVLELLGEATFAATAPGFFGLRDLPGLIADNRCGRSSSFATGLTDLPFGISGRPVLSSRWRFGRTLLRDIPLLLLDLAPVQCVAFRPEYRPVAPLPDFPHVLLALAERRICCSCHSWLWRSRSSVTWRSCSSQMPRVSSSDRVLILRLISERGRGLRSSSVYGAACHSARRKRPLALHRPIEALAAILSLSAGSKKIVQITPDGFEQIKVGCGACNQLDLQLMRLLSIALEATCSCAPSTTSA
jgi:hypothetical protein